MSKRGKYNEDLTGKRFGKLIVIRFSRMGTDSCARWWCKCDCGTEKEIWARNLRNGHTKACGCLRGKDSLYSGEASFNEVFRSYHNRAKKKGLSFRLSKKRFKELVQSNCHYCGAEPSRIAKQEKYNGEFVWNGVDRVNNNYGYSPKNCVPCCTRCNVAKNNASQKEWLSWLDRIIAHNRKVRQ